MKSKKPLNLRKIYSSNAHWSSAQKIMQKLFCLISILSSEFGLFPCKRPRDKSHFKYRKIKVQLNIKFRDFLHICLWDTVSTKFWRHSYRQTDRQTDRHFLKMMKSCSGHFKTCKSLETRMSKIFVNPILSSYVYRRK